MISLLKVLLHRPLFQTDELHAKNIAEIEVIRKNGQRRKRLVAYYSPYYFDNLFVNIKVFISRMIWIYIYKENKPR